MSEAESVIAKWLSRSRPNSKGQGRPLPSPYVKDKPSIREKVIETIEKRKKDRASFDRLVRQQPSTED